jgi:hypothetical protein
MAKSKKKKVTKKRKVTKRKVTKKVVTKSIPPKKRRKKRLAKPKIIMEPPTPGSPDMLLALGPAKGGGPSKGQYIPPTPSSHGNQYPRFAAGMYYTTDLKGTTIERLKRHPMWSKYSLPTLQMWSREDRWVERRRANMKRWQNAIEARIGTEVVKARMKDLEDMRGIYQKMITKLKGKALKAKSYEGMVSALVKLADLMDGWSERLSKEFVPEAPLGGEDPGISVHRHEAKPTISPAEARVAAKAVMQERRQQLRLKQTQEEASEGEDKPSLVVVEGEGG